MKSQATGGPRLRLSPNEEQELIKQEQKKWQIFRLQQVREQSKLESARIRQNCNRQEAKINEEIRSDLKKQWDENHQQQIQQLERQYDECLQSIGAAHIEAQQMERVGLHKARQEKSNRAKALMRGNEALRVETKLQEEKQINKVDKLKPMLKARHEEKVRSKSIAERPLPKALQLKKESPKKMRKMVTLHEAGTFHTSKYKPDITPVRKENDIKMIDPREAARKLEEITKEQEEREKRILFDKEEAIKERGKDALKKERIRQKQKLLLEQLEIAQQRHQLSAFLEGADCTSEQSTNIDSFDEAKAEAAVERLMEQHGYSTSSIEDLSNDSAQEKDIIETDSVDSPSSIDINGTQIEKESILRVLEKIREARENQIYSNPYPNKQENLERQSKFIKNDDLPYKTSKSSISNPNKYTDKENIPIRSQHDREKDYMNKKMNSSEECDSYNVDETDYNNIHTESIHFKPTVPAHELSQRLQFVPKGHSSSDFFDSSTERLKIKIHVEESSSVDSGNNSSDISRSEKYKHTQKPNYYTETSTESEQSPSYLPDSLYENLKRIKENRARINTALSSMPRPEEIPQPLEIEENRLKEIKENRVRINTALSTIPRPEEIPQPLEIEVPPSPALEIPQPTALQIPSPPVIEIQSRPLKTPPRIYTTPLKEDGSGERPIRRRDKFESLKKEAIHQYLKKALLMNPHALRDISVSSVENSGVTVNSFGFISSKSVSETDFTDSESLLTLDSTTIKEYCELDTIPSKLTKHIEDYSYYTPKISRSASDSYSRSRSRYRRPQYNYSSYSDHPSESISIPSFDSFRSNYSSAYESYESSSDYTGTYPPPVRPRSHSLHRKIDVMERLADVQGKKKTILNQMKSDSSSETVKFKRARKLPIPPVQKQSLRSRVSPRRPRDHSTEYRSSSYNEEHSQPSSSVSSNQSKTTAPSKSSSNNASSGSKTSSISIPDMTQVLSKFGFGNWAGSMVKRMNEAEQYSTES